MNLETFTCGAFWLANSITSTIMGFGNRSQQEINAEENQRFQIELENLRADFQEQSEKEKAARMRARMVVLRNQRLIESSKAYELQLASFQIQEFINSYLPINKSYLFTLIEDSKKNLGQYDIVPNVILLHTLQSSLNYRVIEERVAEFCNSIGDVCFRQEYCTKDSGGNSCLLNLHAVLGCTPTIVISPYYVKDVIYVNSAIWDPQSSHPLIKPIFSFKCERERLKKDSEYKKSIEEKISVVAALFSAVARDAYMTITYGKEPILDKLLCNPNYKYIANAIQTNEFEALLEYLKYEYKGTSKFILERKLPTMLQVFSPIDIDAIGNELALIGESLPQKKI